MSNEPLSASRGRWVEPAVTDLPPLTDLTLQTGNVVAHMTDSPGIRAALRATLSSPLPGDR